MNRTMSLNYSKYADTSNLINNVSKRSLARVLIQFMNLQTKEIRTELTKTLCRVSRRLKCDYINNATRFPIMEGIDSGDLSFDTFLRAMNHLQTDLRRYNPSFSFKGFADVIKNYKSLPENSDERKEMKYKGMINCCIVSNQCVDTRKNSFWRTSTPMMCTIGGRTRKRRVNKKKTQRRR
jgi:hypothetical protein